MLCSQPDFDFSHDNNSSLLVVKSDLGEVIHYSFEEEQRVNSLEYACENREIEEINFYIPHSYFLSDEYEGDHVVETVKQPNKMAKTVEKH